MILKPWCATEQWNDIVIYMQNAMYTSLHYLIHHVSLQVIELNACVHVFLILHWPGDVYQAISIKRSTMMCLGLWTYTYVTSA